MSAKTKTVDASNIEVDQASRLSIAAAGSEDAVSMFGIRNTGAGIHIDQFRAYEFSAYFDAVRIISEDIAKLGWMLYERVSDDERKRATSHPLYELIHFSPNAEMTSQTFREVMTQHAAGAGDSYAEIERTNSGDPVAMHFIEPWRVTPFRDTTAGGRIKYRVTNGPGEAASVIDSMDMFHLRGVTGNGVTGHRIHQLAREAIALGLAAELFGASFFGNGTHISRTLKHPGKLSVEAKQKIKASLREDFMGPENSHNVAILEEGMEWDSSSTVDPEKSQLTGTRQFQVVEIARWFRIPPHKLGSLERSTFSNIEEQSIEYVSDTLLPWCKRWDGEASLKLIRSDQRSRYYTELNLNTLLQGRMIDQFTSFEKGRNGGWLSANDIRRMLNMPNIGDSGDIYLVPKNMSSASDVAAGTGPTLESRIDPVMVCARHAIGDLDQRLTRKESKALANMKARYKDETAHAAKLATFTESHITHVSESAAVIIDSVRAALNLPILDLSVPDRLTELLEIDSANTTWAEEFAASLEAAIRKEMKC